MGNTRLELQSRVGFCFFLIAIVVIVIIDWNYGVIIGNIFIFIIKFIDIIYEFQNSKNLIL